MVTEQEQEQAKEQANQEQGDIKYCRRGKKDNRVIEMSHIENWSDEHGPEVIIGYKNVWRYTSEWREVYPDAYTSEFWSWRQKDEVVYFIATHDYWRSSSWRDVNEKLTRAYETKAEAVKVFKFLYEDQQVGDDSYILEVSLNFGDIIKEKALENYLDLIEITNRFELLDL